MRKLCHQRRFLTLVFCLWGFIPLHTARAEGGFTERIVEAIRFYENLDYELALEQLQLARKVARSAEDTVTVALYEGIVQAELGQWEESRAAFREALRGRPEARLPQRVSPKLNREFESQRALVEEELKASRQEAPALANVAPTPAEVARTDEARPTKEASGASAQLGTDLPEAGLARAPSVTTSPALDVVLPEPSTADARSSRVPVLTWALLGVGVAAGGAGTVFGLNSRTQLEDARSSMLRGELTDNHSRSQRSARTANVLFGTAGLAAAGAVVTWLLGGSAAEPMQGVAQ
ncbi:hypothetical protein [Pyxidicoccus sp. MSG2]|uniref:hypothetical protein n=1 Tax=Pyxidicoccus sp. MSG2 TaxID=2996790 RepID=UPI00226EAD8F|nr:hypothetical protein [Pyxidicoccus sp. MSG2]MCY1015632.1 hypothetical protein [Pyxidicoccus sp. MSG2]